VLVTVLAFATMAVSALLLPITFITVLMLIAKSYGTDTADAGGVVAVLIAPPATCVAGLGLLFRWRWARYYMIALLAILIAANVWELSKGGKSTTIHTTAAGVTTSEEVWGGPNHHSVPIIAVCSSALILLFLPFVRHEFQPPAPALAAAPGPSGPEPAGPEPPPGPGERDWRVGHKGRDLMHYEEWRDGAWQRLLIDGEMLMGRPHHVIYFTPAADWENYPAWARHRRDEIIARIKSQFREPDYEYQDGLPKSAALPVVPPTAHPPATPASTPKQRAVLWFVVALFFAITVGMGWLVRNGVETGSTVFPSKRPSLQRPVSREKEPVNFWLIIGFYSVAGVGSAGVALWLVREGIRLKRP
jgi:hypothetical protein